MSNPGILINILLVGLATAAISVTITRTKAFKWLRNLSDQLPVISELFRCYYCMSHWVALILVILLGNNEYGFISFIVRVFASIAVSGVISGLILGGIDE